MNDPAFLVARWKRSYQVLAARSLLAGETILRLEGDVVQTPSRWSVQIGPSHHVDLPAGTCLEEQLDRYPWSFLNHSCHANACIRDRALVAVRPIREGESVSFDYNTNEASLAEPFECACGALDCVGLVRGYAHLDAARRGRLAPFVSEWLVGAQLRSLPA